MSELLRPPAVPVAILNFFASQPDFPAVAGDISEEFHQRAQSSGAKAAKRWYWHETFRNALALTWRELLRTPVRTTLLALGCFFAANIVSSFISRLGLPFVQGPRSMLTIYLTIQLSTLFTMGLVGGKLLPSREWALALTFAVLSACFAEALRWYFPTGRHFPPILWAVVSLGGLMRQSAFWLGCLWTRVHSHLFAANSIAPSTPRSSPPRNPPDPS